MVSEMHDTCEVCGQPIAPHETLLCQPCASVTEQRDGFWTFAPALAESADGFQSGEFLSLFVKEEAHFWFVARNALIQWALERYAPGAHRMLEVGCGTGVVLSHLEQACPNLQLFGSELQVAGLRYARQRVHRSTLFQMDARHIPMKSRFDVIGAFDVLEHIKEDETVLRSMHGALKPGGWLLLTVPQHRWLWSSVDDNAYHERRYTAKELSDKIDRAGYDLKDSTSFVSLLLPTMLASRLQSRSNKTATSELGLHPRLNHFFSMVMDIERWSITHGVRWALGGSRLIVAQKR